LAPVFGFSSTMSAIRDEHSYEFFVSRFRNAKPFNNRYRPAVSAEPALWLAMNSGVRTKPQSMRAALLSNQIIAVPPLALKFPMLRIRPPFLHVFPAARAPSLAKRSANRRLALHCEFRWNRFPLSAHGSSSPRESLPHSCARLPAGYCVSQFGRPSLPCSSSVFPPLPPVAALLLLCDCAPVQHT